MTAEWRAEYNKIVTTDIAVRHDTFNRFKDATSLRTEIAPAWLDAFYTPEIALTRAAAASPVTSAPHA